MLDKIDLQLLRQSMMLSKKSPRSLILLELGLVPVEYLLKQKRINFLHHLLTDEDESLSKKVFLKQVEKPLRGDFVMFVNKDLAELEITMTYDEIKNVPKNKFKELVKEKTKKASFEKLLKDRGKLHKGREIEYEELETQGYLRPGNQLNIHEMRKILQIRIRDTSVRANYKNAHKNTTCPAPDCNYEETQKHLYSSNCWIKVKEGFPVSSNSSNYEDIFEQDVKKQFEVMSIIFQKLTQRDEVIRADGPLDSTIPTLVIRKTKKRLKQQLLQQQKQQHSKRANKRNK